MKCPNCNCELKVDLIYENGMPIDDGSVDIHLEIAKEIHGDYAKPKNNVGAGK